MNLEEVFPRASIEEKEYTIEKIERLLGDNNEVLLNYDNGDYLDDIEHIFEIIKNTVSIVLKIAMRPFMFKHKVKSVKELLDLYHYDFKILEIITLFKTLDDMKDQFTQTSVYSIINNYEQQYQRNSDVKIDAKEKRIKKLHKENKSRNDEHLKYFGYSNEMEMKEKVKDIDYYNFLLDNKKIGNFLYYDTKAINKDMIETFIKGYDEIEKEADFIRFKLDFFLERDSKINIMAAWAFAIANLKNVDETVISSRKNDVKKLHCYNPLKNELDILYYSHQIEDKACKDVYQVFFDVKGRTIETGLYIGEDINKVISNPLLNKLKLNDIVFGLEKICKLWGLGFEKINETIQWINELDVISEYTKCCVSIIFANMFINNKFNINAKYKKRECNYLNREISEYIDEIMYSNSSCEYFDKSFGYMKDGEYHMIKRMQNYRSVIKYLNRIYVNK